MAERPLLDRARSLLANPASASLLATSLLFLICIGLLHPRYAINDDLKIIAIATGYPSAAPSPFLVHINVLLGILLVALYRLPTAVNWEVWLFLALDFLSIWAIAYILCRDGTERWGRLLGTGIVLACGSYFALNVTFTNAAALAGFAGMCLILTSARRSSPVRRIPAAAGIALVAVASMIRIQMLALTVPLVLAGLVFLHRPVDLRRALALLATAGFIVLAAYAADRLYVRAHAEWRAYYYYNSLGEKIRDAHRLENVGFTIKRISWSGNDQELFARLFFPDASIYSVERLRYLVEHVPGTAPDVRGTVTAFYYRLRDASTLPLLLIVAATFLLAAARRVSARKLLALAAITIAVLIENLGLVWAYKDPDYVLLALLASTAMLGALILNWPDAPGTDPRQSAPRMSLPHMASMVVLLAGLCILAGQGVVDSGVNLARRNAYRAILADISRLQEEGMIAPNAIIVSPAHGIPWEWSNPLIVEFPEIPFFDTGWITFSPSYQQTLAHYQLEPLPQALHQRKDVYLMTKLIFQRFLARYYQEHEQIDVTFEPIYNMPNNFHLAEYDDIQLYRVVRVK